MSNRHACSGKISEQQHNRLVQWEMEYDPLELDENLRDAHEAVSGGSGR